MEPKDIKINLPLRKAIFIENFTFNSSHDFRLTEEDLEKAHQELNENENNKVVCLQKLKEKFECNKNVYYRMDDDYLLRYLRWAKYDCDKAYRSINKLYSCRYKYPEFFQLPSNLETFVNNFPCTYFPYKDEKGRTIFNINFRKWNIDELSVKSLFIIINAILDIITLNPHLQVNGVVGIWDFRGISIRHISLIKQPMIPWLLANVLQDLYPWRISKIVGIHCSPLITMTFKLVIKMIKKKIADRVKLLGSDMAELHQYVNPAVLPKEYGGTLEESEFRIKDFIIDNLPYIKYERSFGVQSSS